MVVLRTICEMRAWRKEQAGRRLAGVPTMGALHRGHARLMEEGRGMAEGVVVSVFVNPTQFGLNEDFAKYPRDEQGDLAVCEGAGVEAVFMPTPGEMYAGDASAFADEGRLSAGLCGARRPGHFRGVCTVVLKLMTVMGAEVFVFGEKDYQLLCVIRRMVRDLDVNVEVAGVAVVREEDKVALSSRNRYLSAEERLNARGLSRALMRGATLARGGELRAEMVREEMRACMAASGVRVDYAEVVDGMTLEPLAELRKGCRALVAGWSGTTRLIDNSGLLEGTEWMA